MQLTTFTYCKKSKCKYYNFTEQSISKALNLSICQQLLPFNGVRNIFPPSLDNNDQIAYHTMGWMNGELIASTRLFDINQSYPGYQSIGRVVGSPKHRGIGAGKALMQYSIAECERLFGKHPIKIGAQLYLKKFYNEQGFEQAGEMYYEDDIEHIPMIRH